MISKRLEIAENTYWNHDIRGSAHLLELNEWGEHYRRPLLDLIFHINRGFNWILFRDASEQKRIIIEVHGVQNRSASIIQQSFVSKKHLFLGGIYHWMAKQSLFIGKNSRRIISRSEIEPVVQRSSTVHRIEAAKTHLINPLLHFDSLSAKTLLLICFWQTWTSCEKLRSKTKRKEKKEDTRMNSAVSKPLAFVLGQCSFRDFSSWFRHRSRDSNQLI